MVRGYKFTNKKQSTYGIMSCVFGIMASVTFLICILRSYDLKGVGVERYGTSALLAILFMIAGFALAVYSFLESDKFKLFKIIGIVLNSVALVFLSIILYAGAIL